MQPSIALFAPTLRHTTPVLQIGAITIDLELSNQEQGISVPRKEHEGGIVHRKLD